MSATIFNEWVFGRVPGGTLTHAVYRDKSEDDDLPWYTIRSLCGVGGSQALSATNSLFNPTGRPHVCTDCARKWTARLGPQVEGWTKNCATCRTDKSVTQFHADGRTTDGMSKQCLDCSEQAKRTIKQAEALVQWEANRQQQLADAYRRHQARLEALVRWQRTPDLPTFTCDQGHILKPVSGGQAGIFQPDTLWPCEQWECLCGLTDVTREQASDALTAGRAIDTLRALREKFGGHHV